MVFDTALYQRRKITKDCLISYQGCRYSVPHAFAGREAPYAIMKTAALTFWSTRGWWRLTSSPLLKERHTSLLVTTKGSLMERLALRGVCLS